MGNRPSSYNPFRAQTWKNMNPLRSRVYANDPSLARRSLRALNVGTGMMAVDQAWNGADRRQRAGETGAAMALAQLRQGNAWERARNALGLTFGGDALYEGIRKTQPGVADRLQAIEQSGYKPNSGQTWRDLQNIVLGIT